MRASRTEVSQSDNVSLELSAEKGFNQLTSASESQYSGLSSKGTLVNAI